MDLSENASISTKSSSYPDLDSNNSVDETTILEEANTLNEYQRNELKRIVTGLCMCGKNENDYCWGIACEYFRKKKKSKWIYCELWCFIFSEEFLCLDSDMRDLFELFEFLSNETWIELDETFALISKKLLIQLESLNNHKFKLSKANKNFLMLINEISRIVNISKIHQEIFLFLCKCLIDIIENNDTQNISVLYSILTIERIDILVFNLKLEQKNVIKQALEKHVNYNYNTTDHFYSQLRSNPVPYQVTTCAKLLVKKIDGNKVNDKLGQSVLQDGFSVRSEPDLDDDDHVLILCPFAVTSGVYYYEAIFMGQSLIR